VAEGAGLLVVGSRGLGGFRGLLLARHCPFNGLTLGRCLCWIVSCSSCRGKSVSAFCIDKVGGQ
jgi:hypothetical protein